MNAESLSMIYFAVLTAAITTVFAVIRTVRRKKSVYSLAFSASPAEILLRGLGISFLLAALAKPYFTMELPSSAVTALVDISDSMDESAGDELLETLNAYSTAHSSVNLIPFAKFPASFSSKFRPGQSYYRLKTSWSKLDIGYSDIESALIKASSYSDQNILLISDGFETKGDMSHVFDRLNAASVRIYPLITPNAGSGSRDFKITNLHAPLTAPAQKSVDIRVSIKNASDKDRSGVLEVVHDTKVILKQTVEVKAGQETVIEAKSDPSKEGIKEVTARLTPADTEISPSTQTVFISGERRERILVLHGSSQDRRILDKVIRNQAYRLVSKTDPSSSFNVENPDSFSVIILNNISKKQLPRLFSPSRLEQYVKGGGSLIMIGGNRSFGLGGYRGTPVEKIMPVSFVPPQTVKKRLNVAVALVLDKSKSMASNSKIYYARSAASTVIQNLKDEDLIQIIGFDSTPFIVIPLKTLKEIRATALDRVNRLFPSGRTNLLPALNEAHRSLGRAKAGRKHVIVLTDGKIPFGDLYYLERISQMKKDGITISTVMLGAETDNLLLKNMAKLGGGKFYQTTDAASLAKIFLKDIKVSTGERTLKESSEYAVRKGTGKLTSTSLRAFPPLLGYVQTRAKKLANLELVVYADDKAEPLLASWRYASGKVTAFTSDANGRWSRYWTRWPKFAAFWSDVIDSLRPESKRQGQRIKFDLRYYVEHGVLFLDLSLYSEQKGADLRSNLIKPDGTSIAVNFTAVSRGRYLARVDNPTAGKYELNSKIGKNKLTPVAFNLSGELFGEKKGAGFNIRSLSRLADSTGGEINPSPDRILRAVHKETEKRDLTFLFILAGLILLVMEVLKREVFWSKRSLFNHPLFLERKQSF